MCIRPFSLLLAVLFAALCSNCRADTDVPRSTLHAEDVERFFRVYDAAGGHPTAVDLQHLYLDPGSVGLHQFAYLRDISGENLAAAIARRPTRFEKARQSLVVLPSVCKRVDAALAKLAQIYPRAVFPPVTVAIGRGNSGGTTGRAGVLIGLETICGEEANEANVEDRIVYTITHEYGHIQQSHAEETDRPDASLLFLSLIEGGAELVGELIGGSVSYPQLQRWDKEHQAEWTRAFLADRGKTDLRAWLYNGLGAPERPGDLGYLIGYRIAKAYYDQANDKERALADILNVSQAGAEELLRQSGFAAAQ